ncbi:MAG: hypothetical protein [Olavius algarvensis Gamma 1 endosymbiont]|nr:MAG: hypothetical protein [Olavius algarvensis Gamma 1 endosymbiont]
MKIREVVYKTNNKTAFLRVPQYSLILSILIPVGKAMTDEILTLKEVARCPPGKREARGG